MWHVPLVGCLLGASILDSAYHQAVCIAPKSPCPPIELITTPLLRYNTPAPLCCRLLLMLSALCGVAAASVAAELRSGGPAAASLQLSQAQEQAQVEAEAAEDALEQRLRSRGAAGAADEEGEVTVGPSLPFLGPISGRLASTLLSQLLTALHVGTTLVRRDPRQQPVAQPAAAAGKGGGSSTGREAASLALARATVDRDAELGLELRRNLEAAAAAASVLVQLYPPFAGMCARQPWVAAELAPAGGGSSSGSSGSSGRGGSALRKASPGLARFVAAVAACRT